MFTIRNAGGIALLLAGASWVWLTPSFASQGVDTTGVLWAVTGILSLLTVAGFLVATWALFTRHSWWEPAVLASAALGIVVLIPYWFAATRGGEATGTASWTAFVHVLMVAGMLTLLRVPRLERWVDHHVMST